MALRSKDFKLVREGHDCEKCRVSFQTIRKLRASAERQCPLTRLRLACVKWAVARLSLDADWLGNIYHDTFHFEAVGGSRSFGVEIFELDGM